MWSALLKIPQFPFKCCDNGEGEEHKQGENSKLEQWEGRQNNYDECRQEHIEEEEDENKQRTRKWLLLANGLAQSTRS